MLLRLRENKMDSLRRFREEFERAESFKEWARKKINYLLYDLSVSSEPARRELIHSLIVALGKIGEPDDAKKIVLYLSHGSALVREGTSASLGRIGKGSLIVLSQAIQSADPVTRVHALLAVGETSDRSLLPILKAGLKDHDPIVRSTALTIVNRISQPFAKFPKLLLLEN